MYESCNICSFWEGCSNTGRGKYARCNAWQHKQHRYSADTSVNTITDNPPIMQLCICYLNIHISYSTIVAAGLKPLLLIGTGSLAPVNFSGAVFTCAYFQKIAQISSVCGFII